MAIFPFAGSRFLFLTEGCVIFCWMTGCHKWGMSGTSPLSADLYRDTQTHRNTTPVDILARNVCEPVVPSLYWVNVAQVTRVRFLARVSSLLSLEAEMDAHHLGARNILPESIGLWSLQIALPFMVLCIVNVFKYNKMQSHTISFFAVNAVHVLGCFSAHHQELKLYTQHLVYVKLACCYR